MTKASFRLALPLAALSLGAAEPAARSRAPSLPDLHMISAATSFASLAPDTPFLLTFVVESLGASSGPLSVGVYAAHGPAGTVVPSFAELLGTHPIRTLSKGVRTTFSVPVRVPDCEECGPLTIYVVADPGNAISEPVETNNVSSFTLDVARDHLADLRVSGVTVSPDRGSVTGRVAVRASVTNASEYAAQGPFRVSTYCSADAQLTRSDRRLHSFRVPVLAPGQSLALDQPVTLDAQCGVRALTTWVGVFVDDDDTVKESNEQNDARSAPYWTIKTPDLTPGKLALSTTAGPKGTRVLVSYRLSNQGGAAAGPLRCGVFLSRDPRRLLAGTPLDLASISSLAADTDSGLLEHAVTIPDVARGRWYLGVVADVDAANGEIRKRNNFAAVPFDVTDANLADVLFRATQKEVAPGEVVQVVLSARATGKDAVPATAAGLYYSEDPRLDVERDARLGELAVGRLRPGATTPELTASVVLPKTAAEGYRFLIAVLDETDAIAETDERDNVVITTIRVVAP